MDHYEVLRVSRTASIEEINNAYRKLAIAHHPDANLDDPKSSTEKFKVISAAYEIISDPNKRARYNRDHPLKKPRKKPKPKPKPKEPQEPKYGEDYKTPRAPLRDIWGQPLSPEERKQWEIDAAVEGQDLLGTKKGYPMNNPEAVKKWMELQKKPPPRKVSDDYFYDAFSREYTGNDPSPNLR